MLSSCEPSPAVERLELVASAAAAAIAADSLQRLAELSRLPPPTATSPSSCSS